MVLVQAKLCNDLEGNALPGCATARAAPPMDRKAGSGCLKAGAAGHRPATPRQVMTYHAMR